MAAHSTPAANLNVPADQPPSGRDAWLRDIARAVNLQASAATNTDLQDQIDAEEVSRIAADADLQDQIDAEEAARIAGDAFLQDQVDDIAGTGGLGTITGVAAGTGLTGGGTSGGVTLSLVTPVALVDGGTGAITAPAALTNLGAEAAIVAGTTAQYWRGDKSWQALNKASVGLGNVDNTTDLSKPVSTATQTQLDLKAPLASPALSGSPTAPTAVAGTNSIQLATTAFVVGALPLTITTVTPASGATVTMVSGMRGLYVNTAALAALTIRLPPSPVAGHGVELCFAASVTALTVRDSAGGAIAGAPTNAFGPGAAIIMRYVSGLGWVYWK